LKLYWRNIRVGSLGTEDPATLQALKDGLVSDAADLGVDTTDMDTDLIEFEEGSVVVTITGPRPLIQALRKVANQLTLQGAQPAHVSTSLGSGGGSSGNHSAAVGITVGVVVAVLVVCALVVLHQRRRVTDRPRTGSYSKTRQRDPVTFQNPLVLYLCCLWHVLFEIPD